MFDEKVMSEMEDRYINALREKFAEIETIDPCLPTYKKLISRLDDMPKALLKKLSEANIKFVSKLATNRI